MTRRKKPGRGPQPTLATVRQLETYFIRALLLYREHDIAQRALVNASVGPRRRAVPIHLQIQTDSLFYLSHAALYVVLEAWSNLGFRDLEVDSLLESRLVSHLARFRNETFHYSPRFRSSPFNYTGPETLDWVDGIVGALCAFFLARLGAQARVIHFVTFARQRGS